MQDISGEITNKVRTAMQLSQQFVITPTILIAAQIYQFIARQHAASQLKKTDWQNFDKFAKFTNYQYEIASIPLSEIDMGETEKPLLDNKGNPVVDKDGNQKMEKISMKEEKKRQIKKQLDAMGIHYCIMDEDFSDDNIKIYYAKGDKQIFGQFFGDYVKENLISGEMSQKDLKNMLNEQVSIISVPDEVEKDLKSAMTKTDVSFASIQDLNLTDGQKQIYVPNMSLDTVRQLYTALRNDLIAKGSDPGDMSKISDEQLLATAVSQNIDDYLNKCSKESKDISESFVTEDSKKLDDIIQRYEPLGSMDSVKYITDSNYAQISIDAQTLSAKEGNGNFVCRIPGFTGNNVRFLRLPANQVFMDKKSTRSRYIAFINKNETPEIFSKEGKITEMKQKDLLDQFDKQDKVPMEQMTTQRIISR